MKIQSKHLLSDCDWLSLRSQVPGSQAQQPEHSHIHYASRLTLCTIISGRSMIKCCKMWNSHRMICSTTLAPMCHQIIHKLCDLIYSITSGHCPHYITDTVQPLWHWHCRDGVKRPTAILSGIRWQDKGPGTGLHHCFDNAGRVTGRTSDTNRDFPPSAVQKPLNRSICLLGCGLGWAERSTCSIAFAWWRQCANMGGHIGATWWIRLNRPSAAAMQSYVELLWPLVLTYCTSTEHTVW